MDTKTEDQSGCCIRQDLNACWQSPENECTSSFAKWKPGVVRDLFICFMHGSDDLIKELNVHFGNIVAHVYIHVQEI